MKRRKLFIVAIMIGCMNVSTLYAQSEDIYVAGGQYYYDGFGWNAKWWKNGVQHNLTNYSYEIIWATPFSIFVSGNDVYVSGSVEYVDDFIMYARLWKNGTVQNLANSSGDFSDAYANKIFVSGNDVYVTGEVSDSPKLWKNGVEQYLSGSPTEIADVFVVDTNVYVAGTIRAHAIVWKNGIPHTISDSNYVGYRVYIIQDMYVEDTNVYVVGYMATYRSDNSTHTIAKLWKNQEEINLFDTLQNSTAHNVAVYQDNIYVRLNNNMIWVNGEIETIDGDISDMFVNRGNVYLAGSKNNLPTIWKNGVSKTVVNNSEVFLMAIFVVDNTNGIETLPEENAQLYPNPANNQLFITLPEEAGIAVFKLYDLLGRMVQQHSIETKNSTINVADIPAGLYLYDISTKNRSYKGKIVIER